jgi:hypothetical protein
MTYAPEHEKELLHRSHRPRMGVSQTPHPTSQQARTTEGSHHPRDPRCGLLLRVEKRLSLAVVAPRLRTPWETVYCWFRRWRIDGTWEQLNATLAVRAAANQLGEKRSTECWQVVDSQSAKTTGVGGEHRERVRRWQEGARQETSSAGGHRGLSPEKAKVHSAKIPYPRMA